MEEIDRNALVRMMGIARDVCTAIVDELKDDPSLPDSVRDLLPALRVIDEEAYDDYANLRSDALEPMIAGVQTVSLTLLQGELSNKDKEAIGASLMRVIPRVVNQFRQQERFIATLDDFLNSVAQPALARLFAEHSDEIATSLVSALRERLRAPLGEDEPASLSALEDYFDVLAEDDIRIKGTRIGVEHVLFLAVRRSMSPRQIVRRYETLTLEQVYATLLAYERDKELFDAYLTNYLQVSENARLEFWKNPPDMAGRLRQSLDRKRSERKATQIAKA